MRHLGEWERKMLSQERFKSYYKDVTSSEPDSPWNAVVEDLHEKQYQELIPKQTGTSKPVTLIVIGKTGTGKSTLANAFLMGENEDDVELFNASASINACTYETSS